MLPELIHCSDDGRATPGQALPVLVWRLPAPYQMISSAPLGGGLGPRSWILNATVPMSYARTDPDANLAEIAARLGLGGAGVGLMTGVDVADRVVADDSGVTAVATVGLGTPTWAAAPDGDCRREPRVGTVNIVAHVPVPLSPAALVNAAATVTEAKTQAIWSLGIEATGTASDAVCVTCPRVGAAEPFGGPRSVWGARLARAVYSAVTAGGAAWRATGLAWSDRHELLDSGA